MRHCKVRQVYLLSRLYLDPLENKMVQLKGLSINTFVVVVVVVVKIIFQTQRRFKVNYTVITTKWEL